MAIEEAVVGRISGLIAEAQVLRRGTGDAQVGAQTQSQQCEDWIAAALHAVQLVVPDPDSGYRRIAGELASRKWGDVVNEGVGELSQVLSNLLRDAQAGLIPSIADRARAEVLDGFLDHAKAHLKKGQPGRAGIIAGVIFEDAFRYLCRKHHIEEHELSLDELINRLTAASIFSPTKARSARIAAYLRKEATHSQWSGFDASDVRAAIEFTEELILDHSDAQS